MSSQDVPYTRKRDGVPCIRRVTKVVDGVNVYDILSFTEESKKSELVEHGIMEPVMVTVDKCSSENGNIEILGDIVRM